jgi:hypothetical protein
MSDATKSALQPKTKSLEAAVEPVESENPDGEFKLILSKDNTDRDDENLWADEWMNPLPDRVHMDSDHAWARHQSVPLTVGSGVPAIDETGNLVVKGIYADTDHAQMVRRLVNKKHIWQASVSYMDHELPDGRVVRELLNGTFTGVPANPDAVILESKGMDVSEQETESKVDSKAHGAKGDKPYGNVRYADPGCQHPIDTEEHVRAALSYFGKDSNRAKYSSDQQASIMGRIRSAARRLGVDTSDKQMVALIEGTTALIKMKTAMAPWMLMQGNEGHTDIGSDVGASSVYDADGDNGDDGDDDDDSGGLEWGDMHQSLAQSMHDLAVQIRDTALQLGAQATPITNVDQNWDDQGWSDKALQAIEDGDVDTAKGLLEGFAKFKSGNPGAPTGPYQGVEGMSGENASDTNPGEPLADGELFQKGTAGAAIEPQMKSVDTTDVDSKSLSSSTDDKDAAADNKSAAASVSPADVAARARMRKMQFENAILEMEAS